MLQRARRRWTRLVDWFVPDAVRDGPTEQVWGARTLVSASLFVGLIPPITAILDLTQGSIGRAVASLASQLSFLVAPFALKYTRSLPVAVHLACGLAVLLPTLWMLAGGGVQGTVLPLFAIAPTLAVVLLGGRAGLVWATMVAFALGGLYVLPHLGVRHASLIPFPIESRFANTLIAVAALWGLTAAARHTTLQLLRALTRARDELASANQQLLRAQTEVEAASLAKGRFLATVSHELRTPMNGVIGFTDLLLESEADPERRAALETIQRSGRTMIALVNDVLDYTKLEVGAIELEATEVELSEICANALEIVAQRAHAKQVEVSFVPDPEADVVVLGDPMRLGQILVNLLGNAVKFTEHGEIELRVERSAPGRFALHVRDTGVGIEPAALERLFSPFSQADVSTTRRYGGTGLGLAIVKALAVAMGGDVRVKSELGRGSVFTVHVHLEEVRAAPLPTLGALRNTRVALSAVRRLKRDLQAMLPRLGVVVVDEDPEVVIADERVPASAPEGVPVVWVRRLGWPGVPERPDGGAAIRVPLRAREVARAVARALGSSTEELAPLAPAVPVQPRLEVLLVEDNPVNQKVGIRMLERLGHRVHLAMDGAQAVLQMRERSFDVVLMDCHMPVMDGLEATRAWREAEDGERHLPIYALTASSSTEERDACFGAGMDGFIEKPLTLEVLAKALDTLPTETSISGGWSLTAPP